jgi:hypothetical protein
LTAVALNAFDLFLLATLLLEMRAVIRLTVSWTCAACKDEGWAGQAAAASPKLSMPGSSLLQN